MDRATSETIVSISAGRVPPFVSQSTRRVAPPATAERSVSSEYVESSFHPSKKCSAS